MLKNSVLWIGDHERREFARIADSLSQQSVLTFAASLDEADRTVPQPSYVCFAHSRAGEFDCDELSRAQKRWPAAAVLNILGEWCCGMKRTAKGLADFSVCYSHELPANVTIGQVATISNGSQSPGLKTYPSISVPNGLMDKLVAIYSPSKSYRRGLASTLEQIGVQTIQLTVNHSVAVTGVDFVVWDVAEDANRESSELAVLRERHPAAKILALLTFPREFEVAALQRQGVQVLAQPFALSQLFSFFRQPGELAVTSAA